MSATVTRRLASFPPAAIALPALAWNAFGVVQFVTTMRNTADSFMAMGLSPKQAEVMATLPVWMDVAFALGTFGGLVGSALLWKRSALATPVLAASFAGYVVLYTGDLTQGVFAALGAGQVAVLSTVVAIAAGLWWFSRAVQRLAAPAQA